MRNRIRLLGGFFAIMALLAVQARSVSAQALNMSGTWAMEVTSDANGTTTPTLTLAQDGMTLTGHYTSEVLGEADVTGTVDGRTVSVTFSADAGGVEAPFTYSGDVNEEGVWSGELSVDFDGQAIPAGTFTATKS